MLAKALTCAVVGLDGAIVEVEVDLASNIPVFHDRGTAGCFRAGGEGAGARRHPQQRLPVPEQALLPMLNIASWTRGLSAP